MERSVCFFVQAEHGRGRTCAETAEAAAAETPLPVVSDRHAWQRCMHDPAFQPFAHTLARMDNALAANCLCALADDVARRCGGAAAAVDCRRGAGAGEGAVGRAGDCGGCELLPAHLGLWLYGLMVRLELPITADVAAALRRVVVIAEDARRRRGGGAGDVDNEGAEVGEHGVAVAELAEMECDSEREHGVEEGGGAARGGDDALGEDEVGIGSGHGGADKERAMYDTLRVVAGGFFGQDGTLACIVDDYLVRMSLR